MATNSKSPIQTIKRNKYTASGRQLLGFESRGLHEGDQSIQLMQQSHSTRNSRSQIGSPTGSRPKTTSSCPASGPRHRSRRWDKGHMLCKYCAHDHACPDCEVAAEKEDFTIMSDNARNARQTRTVRRQPRDTAGHTHQDIVRTPKW